MGLATLKLQRSLAIRDSRAAHGRWVASVENSSVVAANVKAHRATPGALRAAVNASRALHGVWKAKVQKIVDLNAAIAKAQPYATTCSMPLALAVAAFEGGESSDGLFRPYQDAVGVWTIGYGHTAADGGPVPGPGVRPLTRAEAETLLLHDLNVNYAPSVARALKADNWHVDQKEFDALTSFCYNLGAGYFAPGFSIGAALLNHSPQGVADAMLNYNHAGGQVLAGLTRRRQWERQLFLGGTYKVA